MAFTEILPGIHYVGVNDRTTTRFESLWSLPYGVSYNSYLVIDEKVALIDTVEVSFGEQFIDNIRAILKDRPIDYLVVDHMEPDHSSSIKTLRLLYPEMQIVGKYGAPVQKALQKLSGLPIETICSTHGPVWQQEIGRVIGIYDQLSRYEGEPGVVIAYGSMYGNTAQMAEKIARELAVQGVKNIIVYNLSYADISNVIRDIFKYDTLIVGSPTYNGELFPEVGSLLQKISERCIPCRKFAYFGSYTWAGAAVRLLGEFAQKMKWEAICQPTEMKQGYDDQGAQCCTALAKAIAEKIR